MRKGCRRKNTMGLRITAWLLCVSILGVWLPGELCRNQVFAGEKQENIWLEAKGESEDPESEGAEPESSKSEGIYAEPAPQLSEPVQQLSEPVQKLSEPVPQLSEPVRQSLGTYSPALGEITEDSRWTAGQLNGDGTITIPTGITLTLGGKVSISGNITILGGGTIQREKEGYLYVEEGKSLAMQEIKLDGCAVSSSQPLIFGMMSSRVSLKGCNFKDCVTEAKNGAAALWMEYGTLELNQCSFTDCKSEVGKHGAMYVCYGTSKFTECTFTGCEAGVDGGAMYIYRGSAEFKECAFNDCSGEDGGAVFFSNGTASLENCAFAGCSAEVEGGAVKAEYGTVALNNGTIENCSAKRAGGGIYALQCKKLTIQGGEFKNNSTTGKTGTGKGGGCIINNGSKLFLNSVTFLNNTSNNRGGCLYNGGNPGTETYINGGTFTGNTCTNTEENLGLEGSGAIFCSSNITNPDTVLQLCGTETFTGGAEGTDGIYLDYVHDLPRFLRIDSALQHTLRIYLNADSASRYVVAKGTAIYSLTETDAQKIIVKDLGHSGKTWHILKDTKNNQIILSEFDLNKKFHIKYDSNGAEGTVEDAGEYTILDSITVQPGDSLKCEGMYFRAWNTDRNGTGVWHKPGSKIAYISQDTTLYAIFGKTPVASFCSGGSNEVETMLARNINPDTGVGRLKMPPLKEFSGWDTQGWTQETDSVTSWPSVQPGAEEVISKDVSYYGVYRRWVTLSYDANGGGSVPPDILSEAYANVREDETVYGFPECRVASEITRTGGYHFVNWNTKKDGSGVSYSADSVYTFKESVTLYAQWTKDPEADYTVEHYKQELSGESYSRADTELLTGEPGTIVRAMAKSYTGFTENTSHSQRKAEGTITADGRLVLRLYYDRNSYEVKFDFNGGNGTAPESQRLLYGSMLQEPKPPVREGYFFSGWYQEKEGMENSRWEFDKPVEENTESRSVTLYAGWKSQTTAEYKVEHYRQELAGDGYTIADTEWFSGVVGTVVTAAPQTYTGFTENQAHLSRKGTGEIAADGSLTMRLYYDRDSYDIKFDLNGGSRPAPQSQILRWGSCLKEPEIPVRAGYSFKGWYHKEEGREEQWEFDKPVEENTEFRTVTLFAKWVDDIAPVFGKAFYQTNCSHFPDWVIGREPMTIIVPITEQGSGVKQADYRLVSLQDAENNSPVPAEIFNDSAQIKEENGQFSAQITVSDDFKGVILMSCTDNAGNCSEETSVIPEKTGILVESNPPEIYFSSEAGQLSQTFPGDVTVNVTVDDGGTSADSRITGGLVSVRYQVDEGEEQAVSLEEFSSPGVFFCQFSTVISGDGEHLLKVTAKDHAGNEAVKQIKVTIRGVDSFKREDSDIPEKDPEKPGTGEESLSKPAASSFREEQPEVPAVTEKPEISGIQGMEPGTGETSGRAYCVVIFLLAGAAYVLIGKRLKEKG